GMGGAMMVPVGRLLLLRRVPKSEMLSAMTWLTMPALLGPVTGPPVGGFLTDAFGWRSVFLINIPVGAIGLALVAWKIPSTLPEDPGPLDARGFTLVGAALALIMVGLETIGRGALPRLLPEASLAAGLALGVLAVRHCLHTPRPAVDFGLLALPTFRSPALAGSIFRAGAGATPFLIPLMLQLAFGASATESGLISFATSLGAFAMKPLVRPVLKRFGFRRVLLFNGLIAAAGVAALSLVTASWPMAAMFLLLAAGGLARSLQFTSLNTLAFADVAPARLAAATSFYGTTQQLSPALGVVIGGAALETSSALAGRHALAQPDFAAAFGVAAACMALALPWHARLPRDAGAAVSGHQTR
ncbi:MAG TPA: MFS transporter, partial [Acetobacteraceae bacterium]|nr:MFS transporter [Acetobacteraceae bacterium]